MAEPVAWMDGQGNLYRYPDDADRGQTMRPLYLEQPTRPTKLLGPNLEEVLNSAGFYKKREWVGLTDKEKNGCLVSADPCECLATPEAQQLMEDVEAKLKEKNT